MLLFKPGLLRTSSVVAVVLQVTHPAIFFSNDVPQE